MRRVGKTLADSAVVREENRKNQEEPANGGRFLTVSRHDKLVPGDTRWFEGGYLAGTVRTSGS